LFPGVGVNFAQSATQWEEKADTLRNPPMLLPNKKQGKHFESIFKTILVTKVSNILFVIIA
jgi:hypothetical protein